MASQSIKSFISVMSIISLEERVNYSVIFAREETLLLVPIQRQSWDIRLAEQVRLAEICLLHHDMCEMCAVCIGQTTPAAAE